MVDATQYTVQYELLRSQVIGAVRSVARGNTGEQVRCTGLALLLSEGMPGWLKAVEGVLRASLAPRPPDLPNPVPHQGSKQSNVMPVWVSSVQREEVTTLLASLILSTRPLAREPSREGYRSW